jgi:hypothetical protein
MKTNWTVTNELKRPQWTEAELEELKKQIQFEIDLDIMERYEWDWEFGKAVDEISNKIKI